MAEEAVKVAVRVRPFNKREKEASAKLCVGMTGNTTIITNPQTGEEKKFTYDFSYWSFDGFTEQPDGYNKPNNSKYHDQAQVFKDLGQGVLTNAWEGYNASLFAYGQTGSGKSYSVVGYGVNKGIVPLLCDSIFKTSATITDKQIEVYFSMLEIYSEIVRDLLNPVADRKQGLMIRQDPTNGFYAQGLDKKIVSSYDAITKLMDEGTSNRTIASTNMNATSSRAHTIVAVTLIQKYKNDAGKEMAKTSVINLVDLAGSERADATGATGDRLKEGAAINLSLTALGNVISALADNSNGKSVKVPYRDSSLTKLLMNALGGNSKTIMVAAISPADINFDESVSTCRYADRAKQIKTKAVVNEDPTEKLIRDLKAENEKLKEMLKNGKIDPSMLEDGHKLSKAEKDAELESMRKQIEQNEKEEEQMKLDYEAKLAAALANKSTVATEREQLLEKIKTVAHFANVNMDPSLSATVFIPIEGDGVKTMGVPGKSDISFRGLMIGDPHGKMTVDKGKYMIEACGDSKILKNGRKVTEAIELQHNDRIVIGSTQYYLFIDPKKASANDKQYTFELMQDEIGKAAGIVSKKGENLTQEQKLSQTELLEIIPEIEEANMISITLDKKVKYTAYPIHPSLRGEYGDQVKIMVEAKNLMSGLKWLWTKEKFHDRKQDMSEYYLDIKEDGKVDQLKFKDYDPFFESPDTPTRIGVANVNLMSLGHMIPVRDKLNILDMRSKKAGLLSVEAVPCDSKGTPIENQIIRNPVQELANKEFSFLLKINAVEGLQPVYEDCYLEFTFPEGTEVFKTNVIKGDNPNFKYSKQFTYTVTPTFMRFLLEQQLFIQLWGEQKHPDPKKLNTTMTTKEYFDKEKEEAESNLNGKLREKSTDPEVQKLQTKIAFLEAKAKKDEETINALKKLLEGSNDKQLAGEGQAVLKKYGFECKDGSIDVFYTTSRDGKKEDVHSSTCTLL